MIPMDKACLDEHLPQSLSRLRPKKESKTNPTLLPHRIFETTTTPGASFRRSKATCVDAPRWPAAARTKPLCMHSMVLHLALVCRWKLPTTIASDVFSASRRHVLLLVYGMTESAPVFL